MTTTATPPGLALRFRGRDQRIAADPTDVADKPLTVDASGAALLFAPAALNGEFLPASLWTGAELVRPVAPDSTGATAPLASWPKVFARSIEQCCGDADTVAVALSGGLDSLAVITRLLSTKPERRVLAVTYEMHDDAGGSSAAAAARQLSELGLECEHLIVAAGERGCPAWSPAGPRLDADPSANAALSARAAEAGATVLLTGNGADEAFGTPRFATAELARHSGAAAALRYLRDAAGSGPGWVGEALAVAARTLPRESSARLYYASNWPGVCDVTSPSIVGKAHRESVEDWGRAWLAEQLDHAGRLVAGGWARADAHEALWPHDDIPAAGAIPERSPFLTDEALRFAQALAPQARYNARLAQAYHRYKAPIIALFPPEAQRVLPAAKQYYRAALARLSHHAVAAERVIAAGILDPDALAECRDTATLLMVRAVEDWLAGAQRRGAAIPGVCTKTP